MAWIPIAAAAMSYLGQQDANETNMEIAQSNSAFNAQQAQFGREFNASEARMQRDWASGQAETARNYMTEMSGTSYQRATKDMMAAGLNPMLAYSQGGASTPSASAPSGSAATGPSASAAANPIIGNKNLAAISGAQAYLQSENLKEQNKNISAQTANTQADTALKTSMMKDPDAEPNAAGDYTTKSWPAQSEMQRSRALHWEVDKARNQVDLTRQQYDLVKQEIRNAVAQERRIQADTRDTTANAVLRELARNEAKNLSEHAGKYSTYGTDFRPFLKDAASSVGTAQRLFNLRR